MRMSLRKLDGFTFPIEWRWSVPVPAGELEQDPVS